MNVLQAHKKAFIDLLDADNVSPALVVLDGIVPVGQLVPFVLLVFSWRTPLSVDEPDKVSLENASDVIDATVICNSVADSQQGVLGVAGRVRAALLGVTPTVAGRVCAPVVHLDGAPVYRDETTLDPTFEIADQYRFTSLPG